jgi:hypothetical protein
MNSVLVLMAAVTVVPASGPEIVSGETEQGLDLRGEWEGVLCDKWGGFCPVRMTTEVLVGQYSSNSGAYIRILTDVRDEGGGKFSMKGWRGIYRQDGPHLSFCFRGDSLGHPTDFRGGNGQTLAILHRVKPRK